MALTRLYKIQTFDSLPLPGAFRDRFTLLRDNATIDIWPIVGGIVSDLVILGESIVQVVNANDGTVLLQIDREPEPFATLDPVST